ncbi:MAG TPA: hypothetical protein VGL66_06570 [Caulobacteraceae bacterium]|jgi:hypothetical protein
MGQLIGFVAQLLSRLFGAWLARPDPVAQASREAGAAQADLAVTRGALEAQWRVTQAAETAPRTDAAVDDLLSKGEA